MKRKGFTLLELLAVIIILAVIALITTPIVLNVVDEAKKSAFQDSTYGLIKSGEYYYTSQILNGGMTSDKVFNFPNNTELEFSGTEPESGYIKVTKEGLVEIAISNGKYCATKGLNESKVTIKDYVEGECGIIIQAPTISLNGDILNIVSNDERTEKYEIYVDGELKTTIAATVADGANVIKAGTYRFNDTLVLPDVPYESELGCAINFTLNTTAVEYGVPMAVTCSKIYAHSTVVSYRVEITDPDMSAVAGSLPRSYPVYAVEGNRYGINGWNTVNFDEGLKTITVTDDAEASEVFYEWFTTNANQIGVSYDLSSLNLEEGRYRITVKAVADAYKDSAESNAVTYVNGTSEPVEPEPTECQHANTTIINASATYTGDTYCNDCNTTIATGNSIEATATLYSDGTFIFSTNASLAEGYTENDVVATYAGKDGWMYKTYSSESSVPWYSKRSSIKSVVIEDDVAPTSTKHWFDCAANLKSAYIGTGVTTIDTEAFDECTNLTSVTFGENSQLTSIGESAFYDCDSLTSFTIGASVTTIGESAFEDCSNLASVTFDNNSPLTLDTWAFYKCNNLKKIYIADLATWCENKIGAFQTAPAQSGASLYLNGELVTDLVIPDTVTKIGAYAFYQFAGLTSVTIPDSVTHIGTWAFYNCIALNSVTFGENSQLTSIGNYAFKNCKLTSFTIGRNVTNIGFSAFKDCSALANVIFENPDGWRVEYKYDTPPSISVSASALSNASTAASYLRSTYLEKDWYRS